MELWGNLRDFSLPDVIQLVGFGRKTGALSVEHAGVGSLLYFEQGNVVHAESAGIEGEEAVFQLFRLSDGEFRFRADLAAPRQTIFMDPTNLVMEAARLLDESTRSEHEEPEPEPEPEPEAVPEPEAAPEPVREQEPEPVVETAPEAGEEAPVFSADDLSAVDQIDVPGASPDAVREEISTLLQKRLGREAKRLMQAVDKCGDSYDEFQQLAKRVERFVSAFVDPGSAKKIARELDEIIRLLHS